MNDRSQSRAETEAAILDLVRAGVLGRWWCERCEDHVPYRLVSLDERFPMMTETESRQRHNEAAHGG